MEEINYERLRRDLVNYFGAATPIFPVAYMDVINIESADEEELLYYARQAGFNISDYIIEDTYRKRF